MKDFLANLLAVAVLSHALWGCCGHHAHEAGEAHDVTLSGFANTTDFGDCSKGQLAVSHNESPCKQPSNDCKENRCQFVSGSVAVQMTMAVLTVNLASMIDSQRIEASFQSSPVADSLPHVRTHLAKQVLLV